MVVVLLARLVVVSSSVINLYPLGVSRNARSGVPRHVDSSQKFPARCRFAAPRQHLAGFFLIDVDSHERAEQIAAQFAGPGGTVELRPTMWPGGDDQ
ncbi:hypothetical protein [Nocardia cyriacigeorgica]|uniref:YCII-related domain-containing protein n=1 Tax=Nocardia cyriacigeorgica TaxID=135487 RepID=A0A5R8NC84_9NOCA|nr:hypothetical protein [Nocardia cyriacigeorgica]TLF73278.1 hypothetical protein FEK34_27475 [Nocardia cyriacigeorgica]